MTYEHTSMQLPLYQWNLSLFNCQLCQTSPATALVENNDEKIKKAQEKEPEAAKEYAIYQLFYQSIQGGFSQSVNKDQKIAEEPVER